jgi:hypothetical protein
MRIIGVAIALFLGVAAGVQAEPSLTFSTSQIYHGEIVYIRGTGFTPNGPVLSHLIRPDQTEYPEEAMKANAKGEVIHQITIVPHTFGSYELLIEDVTLGASASQRFLMVPTTFDKPVKTQAANLPATFGGVWTGTVSGQRAPSPPADALVTLTGGRIGAVVGTVAYPADNCGGELWLVSASPASIQLGEVIRYGQARCNGRALLTLTHGRDGLVSMVWRDITGAGAAQGTLKKRSE